MSICCLNSVSSPKLDLPLFYPPLLFVRIAADLVGSFIGVPADLTAVVFRQTLGPMGVREGKRKQKSHLVFSSLLAVANTAENQEAVL